MWPSAGLSPVRRPGSLIEGLLGRQSLVGARRRPGRCGRLGRRDWHRRRGLNAISSLWTMDLCQDLLGRNLSEADWSPAGAVEPGRPVLGAAVVPAVMLWGKGVLDFVFEVAAVIGPPVAVVFLVAFFWPRAHGRAATATLIAGRAGRTGAVDRRRLGQEVPGWMRRSSTAPACRAPPASCCCALHAGHPAEPAGALRSRHALEPGLVPLALSRRNGDLGGPKKPLHCNGGAFETAPEVPRNGPRTCRRSARRSRPTMCPGTCG